MYELTKNGKLFTSKSVGTGPSSYEKSIYRAAVSQRLRNTGLKNKRSFRRGHQDKQCVVSQKVAKISSFVNKCKCEYKDSLGRILYIVTRRIAGYSQL